MTTRADPLRHLDAELRNLDDRSMLRSPPDLRPVATTPRLLVLCSNDYLGYAAEPWDVSRETSGAGASRLVAGEHASHREAEGEIARWLRAPASLLFSSGYAANLGTVAALARPGDVVVSDALNH